MSKRPRKLNRAETIDTVNELGDILNTLSLAITNEVSEHDLIQLAISKGAQSSNGTVKQICLNIAHADDPVGTINLIRARLADALN